MGDDVHVLCFETVIKAKQENKITNVSPVTWETFRIICKMEKTSVVNTNYNAQLFKNSVNSNYFRT